MSTFAPGDRIIYNGMYIGILIERTDKSGNEHWRVCWEDGADTKDVVYPASDMVYANGGPSSASVVAEKWLALVTASANLGTAVGMWQKALDEYKEVNPYNRNEDEK